MALHVIPSEGSHDESRDLLIKNMPTKIAFFGTHEFGAIILKSLAQDDRFLVDLVITQPDKPVGRKQVLTPPPVKILADTLGIKTEQPENLKNFHLEKDEFDVAVTAQYGLLIPSHVFSETKHGCINVHTSLLPKYRGASPIQSALINGEAETGVTIMVMDAGMDTGDILSQEKITINPDETYPELDMKLAKIGSTLLMKTLPDYINGKIIPQKQDESKVTVCKKLSRDDGKINWNNTTEEIYNLYRGTKPWPGIWTTLNGERVKLLEIKPAQEKFDPGYIRCKEDTILVGTKNGSIKIEKIQFEGKQSLDVNACLAGYWLTLDAQTCE